MAIRKIMTYISVQICSPGAVRYGQMPAGPRDAFRCVAGKLCRERVRPCIQAAVNGHVNGNRTVTRKIKN